MISVLMSVYNEELGEISESVDSILSQSYTDFELIIVVDNPQNTSAIELLDKYVAKDHRVRVLINETNIGLALSMNRAASVANGEFFLRMDADDICLPDRFKKQIECITSGKYDLVCANYNFVDENRILLSQTAPVFSDKQISLLLPSRNVIHHPTVIMRADTFRKVGGYRNYLCGQDYDLWLRMLCDDCKFHMMPEKVIDYRVRNASTTVMFRYKQSCTGDYIRRLYKKKMRGYSYDGYLAFLDKHNARKPEAQEDYKKNSALYMSSIDLLRKKHLLAGAKGIIKVLLFSKNYRPHILRSLKIAVIKKCFK